MVDRSRTKICGRCCEWSPCESVIAEGPIAIAACHGLIGVEDIFPREKMELRRTAIISHNRWMATTNENFPTHTDGGRWPWFQIALALAVVAGAYLYRLDRPLLWGDEADTGVVARNVLRVGYPVAYDDRNVTMFENGSQLNRELVCKKNSLGAVLFGRAVDRAVRRFDGWVARGICIDRRGGVFFRFTPF